MVEKKEPLYGNPWENMLGRKNGYNAIYDSKLEYV